jgi:glucose-6-phosphate isomerase
MSNQLWDRFLEYSCHTPSIEMTVDVSRMKFPAAYFEKMKPAIENAYRSMDALEKGEIANPDEQRMVGHYWLRNPQLAPYSEITLEIQQVYERIKSFASSVHERQIKPPSAAAFTRLLVIGIGGSALGPMFVSDALSEAGTDRMEVSFVDNTDPDGIERVLGRLAGHLNETLTIVTSKSGGTPESRNGMLLSGRAYKAAGLDFASHAIAITMEGSALGTLAEQDRWLARFPMFDWIGGRTSEMSSVGLLPAALQGFDIDALLEGAMLCDEATRSHETMKNPAALLALAWYHVTGGRGAKDMVVLPYKDRLLLFSRYLQQLVMESLGKRFDLNGNRVDQGLSVYGNKGSTDQHAYVQQLRDGVNNFFAVFVRVLKDGGSLSEVEPQITAGDYLHGFLVGTRAALYENDRESITITVPQVDARSIGALIALFERAVGLYASLVNVNAYHQPGVEAGKKAAAAVLELEKKILAALGAELTTAELVAGKIGASEETETVFLILEHLASNGRAVIERGESPKTTRFHK